MPCNFWSLAFKLAKSSHVASASAVALLLSLLCACCLSFLPPRQTNSSKKLPQKNTCFYTVANQIVKRSGVGVGGCVSSLSVPMCSFSPYVWWSDLQPVLVTKASPASLIKERTFEKAGIAF